MEKRPIDKILSPFRKFSRKNYAVGLLLFVSAALAMIWANSPFKESYFHIWELELFVGREGKPLIHTLHYWINDGLMSVFFFLVGLEIKKEVLTGKLSSFKEAVLPAGAAIGGMLVPAAIYLLFTDGTNAADGWGIPMATDIAFALGLITIVRSRVPVGVKIFLTALAIVDDLGAVLVIALFYSSDISFIELGKGVGFLGLLITGNILRIRSAWFYGIIGIGGLWVAFMFSGVHATAAGVLAALTIPARTVITEEQFSERLGVLLKAFKKNMEQDKEVDTEYETDVIGKVIEAANYAQPPLQKLMKTIHPLVYFFIMPIFAFANAGVTLEGDFIETLMSPICLGVIAGLIIGKCLGISVFSWVLVKTGIGKLPSRTNWQHLIGASLLAGVGFTMSLFIAGLAFDGGNEHQAKVGILVASIIAAASGLFMLYKQPETEY